jgi:hypothetical protein
LESSVNGNPKYQYYFNRMPDFEYFKKANGATDGNTWELPPDADALAFALFYWAGQREYAPHFLYPVTRFDEMVKCFVNDFVPHLSDAVSEIISAEPNRVFTKKVNPDPGLQIEPSQLGLLVLQAVVELPESHTRQFGDVIGKVIQFAERDGFLSSKPDIQASLPGKDHTRINDILNDFGRLGLIRPGTGREGSSATDFPFYRPTHLAYDVFYGKVRLPEELAPASSPSIQLDQNAVPSMRRRYQVFISSTFHDLKDERQAAVEAVLGAGHIPAGMELFMAGNQSQWDHIKEWIEQSDIYMLILGGRYGSLEPSSGKSYTQLEYEYAKSLDKPLFSILLSDSLLSAKARVDATFVVDISGDGYKSFRDVVMKKMIKRVDTLGDLRHAVSGSLSQIEKKFDLDGWVSWKQVQSMLAGGSIPQLSVKPDDRELRQQEVLKAQARPRFAVTNSYYVRDKKVEVTLKNIGGRAERFTIEPPQMGIIESPYIEPLVNTDQEVKFRLDNVQCPFEFKVTFQDIYGNADLDVCKIQTASRPGSPRIR